MTAAADSAPARSSATVRTYARDWDLFTDWCVVTGRSALPAVPDTVVAFLHDCPAAVGTLRRRVTAIDHQHSNSGHPKPGECSVVRSAVDRHSAEPVDTADPHPAAVDAALRLLPSHGWTSGMFGRRDRCVLVLSQVAGVPYRHLATRTAGDITLLEGTARIRSDAGTWKLLPGDNALLCGPCAITRWLRALDVEITTPSTRVLANRIRKAPPVTDRSPHLCRSTRPLSPETLDAPLLVSIDQWGYVPFPLRRLTPHSLSQRVRDLLAGNLGAHRHLPTDGAEDTAPETPAPAPVVRRGVYTREDSQRAWAKRRADVAHLAGVDDLLNEVDARVRELERRTASILVGQTGPISEPNAAESHATAPRTSG